MWLVAVLLACLLAPAAGVNGESTHDEFRGIQGGPIVPDPLAQWLRSIVVQIPITKSSKLFNVSDLQCTNITIGQIDTKLKMPLTYHMDLEKIALNCSGKYQIFNTKKLSGAFTVGSVSSSVRSDVVLTQYPENHTAHTAELENVDLDFQLSLYWDNKPPSFSSKLLVDFVDELLDLFVGGALRGLVKNKLNGVLAQANTKIAPYLKPIPTPDPSKPSGINPDVGPYLVDLSHSPALGVVDYFLTDLIEPSGPLNLNKLAGYFTNNTGSFNITRLRLDLPEFEVDGVKLALGLRSLAMEGLNTWDKWELFKPLSNFSLDSHTHIGKLGLNFGFQVNVTLPPTGTVSGATLSETAEFRIAMTDAGMRGLLEMALFSNLTDLSPSQLIKPGCLLESVYVLNFTQLLLNATFDEFELRASSGPGTLEYQLDGAVDNFMALFISSFNSIISPAMNGLAAGPGTMAATNYVINMIQKATCPLPHTNPVSLLGTEIAYAAGFVFIIATIILVAIQSRFAAHSHEDGLMLLNAPDEDQEDLKGDPSWSLASNPRIHPVFRYTIPVVVVIAFATFASAHTSLGAGVMMRIVVGEKIIDLPSLFNFTLGNSIHDMWTAKVYPLSIFIALFSGAWVYLKLVLLYVCWVVPARLLSIRKRESVLMFLDAYGKWSLIDAYVLIIMIVAFNFRLAVPATGDSRFPEADTSITVYVKPGWGFYGFIVATVLSLILTHVMLHFHRKEHQFQPKSAVASLSLGRCPFVWGDSTVHFTPSGFWMVPVLIMGTSVLLIFGAISRSFDFEFSGLFELVLGFLDQPRVRPFSLISLGEQMPHAALHSMNPGIRIIQALYFMYSLALPLLLLLLLAVIWIIPMKTAAQRIIYIFSEVCNAWASLDVFVFSIIISLLELEQFALFIVGNKCDLINDIIAKYFDAQVQGDDRCFDVKSALFSGCYALISACLLNFIVSRVVMATCHDALAERLETERLGSHPRRNTWVPSHGNCFKRCCASLGLKFSRGLRSILLKAQIIEMTDHTVVKLSKGAGIN